MKIKNKKRIALALAAVMTFSGIIVPAEGATSKNITKIVISNRDELELKMQIGDTIQLETETTPTKHNDTLKYISFNKEVAVVSQKGNVRAVNEGTATIKVKAVKGKVYKKVKITVVKVSLGAKKTGDYSVEVTNGRNMLNQTFSVMKNGASQKFEKELSDDGKRAILTMTNKLTEGEYIVTVGDESASFMGESAAPVMLRYKRGKLIYDNPFLNEEDIKDFVMEGKGVAEFHNGKMRLKTLVREDVQDGTAQATNIVYWCNENFPSDVVIEFDYLPVYEPGLCILFFAAQGRNGEDLFDPSLKERTGDYAHYYGGDINCFHLSYYRRKYEKEKRFAVCNLRKSYGGNMVAQAANPLPNVGSVTTPYHITIVKCKNEVAFYIDGLPILCWQDDAKTYGDLLQGGKVGFRQMSPGIFEYSNFKVYEATMNEEYSDVPCVAKY